MDPELIIFAAVAVFVITRLYSVLGRKTGAEPPPNVLREGAARRSEPESNEVDSPIRPAFTGPGAAGMEAIAAEDPSFRPDEFVRGARKAYEMIVTGFADGDKATLETLLNDDVYEAYAQAIDARDDTSPEPLRLMRLRSAEIADAEVTSNGIAQMSISFEAMLSDGENERTAKEIWLFERPATSDNPNWRLAEVSKAS